MSDHMTWEICPYLRAARRGGLGVRRCQGAPAENRPVEFDCRTGCRVRPEVFAEMSSARSS
jgi:hypothetical protein